MLLLGTQAVRRKRSEGGACLSEVDVHMLAAVMHPVALLLPLLLPLPRIARHIFPRVILASHIIVGEHLSRRRVARHGVAHV